MLQKGASQGPKDCSVEAYNRRLQSLHVDLEEGANLRCDMTLLCQLGPCKRKVLGSTLGHLYAAACDGFVHFCCCHMTP